MTRVTQLLTQIQTEYQTILQENLIGIYLHGSLALGCFHWERSDLDFIVVTRSEPSQAEKEALVGALLRLTPSAPPKGFEMSVVLQKDCQRFTHPCPFVLHYSNAHLAACRENLSAYCQRMHGNDPDLAAHFTILHHAGQVLCGPAIAEVFAPVPPNAYWNSIWGDICEAPQTIHEDPVYTILNLCRVLAYRQDKLVLSKAQGGFWGAAHLAPPFASLARRARNAYETGADETFCENELNDFARFMLSAIAC